MANYSDLKDEKKEVNNDYQPSEGEKKLVKKIEKMLDRAKAHRAKYDEKWLDYYQMFRGHQWKEARPSYRHSEVINLVFQTIQSVIPIITDRRPTIKFSPQEPFDTKITETLNDIIMSDWTRENWSEELVEGLYDSHFYGSAIFELYYDPDAYNDLGQIKWETKDMMYFYADPKATDVNKKCRYVCYIEPTSLDEIKRKWPSKGKYVKADIDDYRDEKTDMQNIKFRSPDKNAFMYEVNKPITEDQTPEALVITAYWCDDSYEESEKSEEDESGKKTKKYVQKKKYPGGRKTVIANKIVLQDGENKYEDQKWPFQRLVNYTLPREFYGESEVAQLEGPQKIFNKLVSFTLDVLTLMGNPIWVVDNNSGIDTDNLYNRPGLVVEKNPGSEVRRESGVELQPYVISIIDRMKSWFDQLSGATDITRGVKPEGVQAGIAINSLMEAAQTRIRLKSRHLDAMLQNMGQAYLSRVFQFYSLPRIVRISPENNEEAAKYFKFHISNEEFEDDDGEKQSKKVAVITRFDLNENNDYVESNDVERIEIKGQFDVRVDTGTQLPFARFEKENKMLQYFDRGIIDREEVLKNSDFTNWKDILKRITEKEQALAQAQAQQQAK